MYKSTGESKSKDVFSSVSNPIKHSHQYIQQIADLKRQNADPKTIKNKAHKFTAMSHEQWTRYQAEQASP